MARSTTARAAGDTSGGIGGGGALFQPVTLAQYRPSVDHLDPSTKAAI